MLINEPTNNFCPIIHEQKGIPIILFGLNSQIGYFRNVTILDIRLFVAAHPLSLCTYFRDRRESRNNQIITILADVRIFWWEVIRGRQP